MRWILLVLIPLLAGCATTEGIIDATCTKEEVYLGSQDQYHGWLDVCDGAPAGAIENLSPSCHVGMAAVVVDPNATGHATLALVAYNGTIFDARADPGAFLSQSFEVPVKVQIETSDDFSGRLTLGYACESPA